MHETLLLLQRRLFESVRGMTPEETQRRRAAGKWSTQQIIEHLVLSYESTAGTVGERLKKGTSTKAKPSTGQRLGQIAIMRFGYFPAGRAAPLLVCPPETTARALSAVELDASIAGSLSLLDDLLTRAEEVFGAKQQAISHMVLGPLTVDQWRRFHLAHGTHHVRQIVATRQAIKGGG